MRDRKKILLAVGGTGGHIYPAQALARDLQKADEELEILFSGGRLASNPYFHHNAFPYREVQSCSPFREGPLKTALTLSKGVKESLSLCREFSPQLIVGFGSFHSFPLLVAARLKKIPYLLVESNALPGKVNRLFSPKALLSAVQFEEAGDTLRGKIVSAKIPFWAEGEKVSPSREEARRSFGLDPELLTLLVFGGSQGASSINEGMAALELGTSHQVLHFCGEEKEVGSLEESYRERGIRAHVRAFEKEMERAWAAADFAICRSGAGTINEMIAYGVPGVLIPWPHAADDHQHRNAEVISQTGGALLLAEKEMVSLSEKVGAGIQRIEEMRDALHLIKKQEKEELSKLVLRHIHEVVE